MEVEGEAFGPGPARGTLPDQMPVGGFLGKGLVNSFFNGGDTHGTLTSPPFKIERRLPQLPHRRRRAPGEDLHQPARRRQGRPHRHRAEHQPGGSEQLDWQAWDVGDLPGKKATIEIVDERTGGWGHINVDHIVQSDRKKQASTPVAREIAVDEAIPAPPRQDRRAPSGA